MPLALELSRVSPEIRAAPTLWRASRSARESFRALQRLSRDPPEPGSQFAVWDETSAVPQPVFSSEFRSPFGCEIGLRPSLIWF